MTDYTALLENRVEQENGSISYDLIIKDGQDERVVKTDFTVEPRQEERDDFEEMVENVATNRIKMIEGDEGKDHSGKEVSL